MDFLNRHDTNGNGAIAALDLETERQRMNDMVGLTGQTTTKRAEGDEDDDLLFADEPSEVDQPFERSQAKFWEKGTSHILFIGIAAALVMGLLLSFYNSIAGGGGATQTAKVDPAKKDDFFGSVPKDGTGDWKTQAALADQKAALRNLQTKAPPAPAKVPPKLVSTAPVVRSAYVPPTLPAPAPRVESFSPPPAPSFSPPSFVPAAPPPTLDETQKKWEALGKIASWGADDNNGGYAGGLAGASGGYAGAPGAYTPAIAQSNPIPQPPFLQAPFPQPPAPSSQFTPSQFTPTQFTPTQQVGNSQPVGAQPLAPAPDESSIFSGVARKTIPIGTRVSGKLETPIVASSSQNGDLFVVSLKQPLKATDGSIVLPQGAQIIVRVDGVNGGGLMRVSAVSANGGNGDVQLPQGAIEIRGEKGRPLIAQNLNRPKGNGFLKNLALFGIGGLSRGAQLFNQPLSSVATVNNGSTIISNTNPAPDYFAGMLEGGTSAVLPGIQASLENRNDSRNREPLWAIKPNTDIEIFVNQTVSL